MLKLSTLAVASLSLGATAFAPSASSLARAPTALRAEVPVIDEEDIPVIDEDSPVPPPMVGLVRLQLSWFLQTTRHRPTLRQLNIHAIPPFSSTLVLFLASRAPSV